MIQVTAITAAYNAASYIENCIQSVLAQTVPCRMVIVDDASLDDTYAIAMRYAEEYPDRITVLKNEQNAGAAASRNRAAACATTPYVAILDADKEGFLRSSTSLIQTIGRAARNAEGHVIMYADTITDSMKAALEETNRRREIQMKYNEEHGITPQTIKKAVRDLISISKVIAKEEMQFERDAEEMDREELEKHIGQIKKKMEKAAAELNFEAAAEYRDRLIELKNMLRDM